MRNLLKTATAASLVVCVGFSGLALGADDDDDDDDLINDSFARIPATTPSGSGHTVLGECGDAFDAATATLKLEQEDADSVVKIKMREGKPDTVYTVWLRMKGNDANGNAINPNGSPITGGGATPLTPGYTLPGVLHYSPPNPGTDMPTNGFTTNSKGDANWSIALDFPVIRGAYPFNVVGLAPTAIVNPAEDGVSGPFMLRIVSHCQDGLAHGVSPGARESWFDWPE